MTALAEIFVVIKPETDRFEPQLRKKLAHVERLLGRDEDRNPVRGRSPAPSAARERPFAKKSGRYLAIARLAELNARRDPW